MFAIIGNKISNVFGRLKRLGREDDQNRIDGRKPDRADELSSSKVTHTDTQVRELRDALALFENERDRLSNEIVDLEGHKRNFRQAMASLEWYGHQRREQLAELRKKYDQLKSELISTEMKCHRQANELATLRVEVRWLRKVQFDMEKERECLEKKVDRTEKEKVALEDALLALKKEEGTIAKRVFSPTGLLAVTDKVESLPLGVACR